MCGLHIFINLNQIKFDKFRCQMFRGVPRKTEGRKNKYSDWQPGPGVLRNPSGDCRLTILYGNF